MEKKKLINRLNRVEGQLKKLNSSIEQEKACEDLVPQFLAVKGALNSAFDEYMKLSLDSCEKADKNNIKKIITLLIKN